MKDHGRVTLRSPGAYGRWLFLLLVVSVLLTMDCPTVQSSRFAPTTKNRKTAGEISPFHSSPKRLNFPRDSLKLTLTANSKRPRWTKLTLTANSKTPRWTKLTLTANSKTPRWTDPFLWSDHHHFSQHVPTAHTQTPAWLRKLFWSFDDWKFILHALKLTQATNKPTAGKKPTTEEKPTAGDNKLPGSGNQIDKHSNVAYQLTHSMNQSADPCQDFYQYTCGNCHLGHSAKEGGTLHNLVNLRVKALLETPYDSATEGLYIKATKDLYQACIDEDQLRRLGSKPVQDLLERLGMRPWMTLEQSPPPSFNVEAMLVKLTYQGVSPFFKVMVNADAHNNTKQIVWINPGTLGISRQYLVLGRTSLEVITYKKWCYDMVVNVLGLQPSPALNRSVTEAVDFEIKLADIYPRSARASSVSSGNHKTFALSDLNDVYPNFNWAKYLKLFFQMSKVNLSPHLPVSVHHEFVRNLTTIIAQTDKRVLANYLLMRVVRYSYSHLNKEIRDLEIPMRMVLFGMNHSLPHWQPCVTLVSKIMMNPVGSMYVARHFSPQEKQKATDVVEFIRDAMQEIIVQSRWIDNATKAKALEKSEKLKANVGYPEYLLNKTYLEAMYHNVVFDPKAHFQNVMKVNFLSTARNARSLFRPAPPRDQWAVSATDVNAYYDSTSNVMFCPAAILQPPFFGDEFPMSMIFGAIGMVISHELTHAFDDQGRKFDEEGNKASWWDEASKLKFDQQAQCFVDQFNKIVYAGHHINGNATLSENIADNGGVKIAFRAFKKWQVRKGPEQVQLPNLSFTPDQLFFISLAQMWCNVMTNQQVKASVLTYDHSPNNIRANMVMSNSMNFSQAFNCPAGSRMNPTNKCQLW